jgi:hypothetical protein
MTNYYEVACDRLEKTVKRLNGLLQIKAKEVAFPEDIKKIREEIEGLEEWDDLELVYAYKMYSQEYWCANWVYLDATALSDFKHYLEKLELL